MVSDSELPEADQLGKTEVFPLSRPESVGQTDRWSGADGSALFGNRRTYHEKTDVGSGAGLYASGRVRAGADGACGTGDPQAGAPVIAYVPLDDRPDNAERVVYLAESLGYELAMPERDLYRTRLDGQPPNENGTQYGDRGALYGGWLSRRPPGVTGTSCPWISCSPAGWSAPGL